MKVTVIILMILIVVVVILLANYIVREQKKIATDTNNLNLLFVGDSYTDTPMSYANQLQKYLPQSNITKVASVGKQTGWMLENASADLSSGKYSAVFILGGVNDIYATNSITDAKRNLQAMYTMAHNAGSKVVAITVAPTNGYELYDANKGKLTTELNAWIKQASDVDFVIDQYTLLSKNGTQNTALFAQDKLHPTAQAQNLLAQKIETTVFS